jgi:HEAT repeat protein
MWKPWWVLIGLLAVGMTGPLQEAIEALDSIDPVERARATCPLAKMKEEAAPAVPKLVELLGDAAPIRDFACKEKGGSWRETDSTTPGREAAKTLSRIGEVAVGPLVSALENGDTATRANAAFAMQMVPDPRVIDPLLRALGDHAALVREEAAWALSSKVDDRVAPGLAGALEDPDPRIRRKAAWSLGIQGSDSSVEPLITALKDEDEEVRVQAAWALGVKGDARSVEPLGAALADESADVREKAAWALGIAGDVRAAEPLISALEDPGQEVRRQAAWALGVIGDPRALEPLHAVSTNRGEDKKVRAEARRAEQLLTTASVLVEETRALSSEAVLGPGQRLRIQLERGSFHIEAADTDRLQTEVTVSCYEGKVSCVKLLSVVTLDARSSANDLQLDVGGVSRKKKEKKAAQRQLAWDAVVRVPRSTPVRVSLRVGDVTILGLENDIDIDLGVGSVDLELSQRAVSRVELRSDMGHPELEGQDIEDEIRHHDDGDHGHALEWAGGSGNANVNVEVGVGSISMRLIGGQEAT